VFTACLAETASIGFGGRKGSGKQQAGLLDGIQYVGAGLTALVWAGLGSLSLGCMDRISSTLSPRSAHFYAYVVERKTRFAKPLIGRNYDEESNVRPTSPRVFSSCITILSYGRCWVFAYSFDVYLEGEARAT